jgi:hypothetical protein
MGRIRYLTQCPPDGRSAEAPSAKPLMDSRYQLTLGNYSIKLQRRLLLPCTSSAWSLAPQQKYHVCRLSALTDASSPRHSNLAIDPLLSLEIDAHADVGGAFFEDVLTPLLATRMELPYACDPMLIQIAIAGT